VFYKALQYYYCYYYCYFITHNSLSVSTSVVHLKFITGPP